MIRTALTLVAFMAVVVAASGVPLGLFLPAGRGVIPPETCKCGAPRTAGHQCGGG